MLTDEEKAERMGLRPRPKYVAGDSFACCALSGTANNRRERLWDLMREDTEAKIATNHRHSEMLRVKAEIEDLEAAIDLIRSSNESSTKAA